ncbi:MAG: PaaI family thioesterase [Ktedonobacterales bacterium]
MASERALGMGKEEQTRVGSDDEREDSAIARSGAGSAEAEVERSNGPAFYEYWNQMDMLSWMGARITDSADGHATVYFEPGEHHRGAGVGGRAVTGAVQAYIFDIVTGAAVASLAHGTKPQVTVKLDVTFERPAYDAPLTFEARVQSGGRQIFFVEGVCRDTNGAVCSRAVAIYRRFERRLSAPAE